MKPFHFNVFSELILIAVVSHSCYSETAYNDCYYEGRVYVSGQRIPQEEECHICLCYKGQVECSWMDCPAPPDSCEEMIIPGECNPTLYICPIPQELIHVSSTLLERLKRASDVLPNFFNESKSADCMVLGVPYKTGDLMGVASHPCLECRCARGELYCSPRCCFTPMRPGEKPGVIMRALSRASRLQQKHPLDHLWEELDLIWN